MRPITSINFITLMLSLGIIPGFVQASDDTLPRKTITIKALYGFSKSQWLVRGKTDSEIIMWIKKLGFNAVFFSHKDSTFIERLQKEGIKVYVEYSVFVGEKLWQKYPTSRPVTAKGKKLKKYKWYAAVNPTVEEIRQQKLDGIRSLVKETVVDGIWLDFIRWPCHWEVPTPKILQTSFDQLTIKKFAADTGLSALLKYDNKRLMADKILTEHLDQWTCWKCQQITSFVAEARKIVDSAKRRILLGAFTVPWTYSDYDGAIRTIIGHDYEALGKYLDVISPMLYHSMCNRSVDWIGTVTTKIAGKVGCDICPIIRLADEPVKIPSLELEKALKTAITAQGSTGIILFSMQDLDSAKIKVIKDTFSHF